MAAIAFDTLKFARRLMDAGMPEEQAEVQAELMAEAFVFNMDSLVTRDYLDARLDARFAEQDARIDARFAEQDARIEARFAEQGARFEARFTEQDTRFEQLDTRLNSGISEHAAHLGSIEERIDKQKTSLTGLIDDRYNELKAMFLEKNAHNEVRFTEIHGQLKLHTWILGAIAASTVLPLLHSLFSL